MSSMMQFKTYDEVDPRAVANLALAGFGWNLDANSVNKLRKQDKNCSDWFAMYAVEGDDVIGQVGAAYPTIKTIEGPMKLGYIWGVTTQPDKTQKGVARKLMERVHEEMREDGADIFALSTMRSLVAYNLYVSQGYHHIQPYGWNQRLSREYKREGIRVKIRKRSTAQMFDLYRKFSKGAFGFVHRHPKFVEPRCLWFPYISDIITFSRNEGPIGYALVASGKRGVVIREFFCPNLDDIPGCVRAIESRYKRKYITCLFHSRDDVIKALDSVNLAPTSPSFGVLMMRMPKGRSSEKYIKKLVGKDKGLFQFTSTDEY
jgi:predicted N-acetyltransferase YhbS